MRQELIQDLMCLDCESSTLAYGHIEFAGEEIKCGYMHCKCCGAIYPIYNYAPILFHANKLNYFLTPEEKSYLTSLNAYDAIQSRASKQAIDESVKKMFNLYTFCFPFYMKNKEKSLDKFNFTLEQFKNFNAISEEEINGKDILIAGGGVGRELTIVLNEYTPKSVTMIDLTAGCFNLRDHYPFLEHVDIIRGDLSTRVLRRTFDAVICDHVIQHVYNMQDAVQSLYNYAKYKGRVCINHYSKENNFLMSAGIEPAKKLLLKLSPQALWKLSIIFSIPLYILIKFVYMPLNKLFNNADFLPLNANMKYYNRFTYHMIRIICFDLLATPITYYRDRDELDRYFQSFSFSDTSTYLHAGTIWCFSGRKEQSVNEMTPHLATSLSAAS